jgi:activator of HSP90 ATPase
MPRHVMLAVNLPSTPDRLYDMYLDAEIHAAITGLPVAIGSHAGAEFSAFNGMISGTILYLEPKCLIVQAWRSARWPATSLDSTLVLSFWPDDEGARIELVHVNVPDEDFAGVSEGWERYYWTPWRNYLSGH